MLRAAFSYRRGSGIRPLTHVTFFRLTTLPAGGGLCPTQGGYPFIKPGVPLGGKDLILRHIPWYAEARNAQNRF